MKRRGESSKGLAISVCSVTGKGAKGTAGKAGNEKGGP